MIREGGRALQAYKKILAWVTEVFETIEKESYTAVLRELESKVEEMEEGMSIMMHHDAITGTATQYVTYDYIDILNRPWRKVEKVRPFVGDS